MKGRIILKNADFSANNIGRYLALSELTKSVLAKQTQYNASSAEATILDAFLNSLTQKGFIGGDDPILSLLFLPCLASSHNEMMYNIAKVRNGYPINEMAQIEMDASEDQQAYKPVYDGSKIIGMKAYQTSATTDVTNKRAFESYVLNQGTGQKLGSFSYVSYHLSPAPGWINVFFSTRQPIGTTVRFNAHTDSPGYVAAVYGDSDIMRASLEGDLKGFVGISYKSGERFYGVMDNGTLGESSYNASVMDVNPDNYVTICAADHPSTHTSTAVFALGKFMDTAKLTELRTIINDFLSSLNII